MQSTVTKEYADWCAMRLAESGKSYVPLIVRDILYELGIRIKGEAYTPALVSHLPTRWRMFKWLILGPKHFEKMKWDVVLITTHNAEGE